jgi:cation transport regulator ChaB
MNDTIGEVHTMPKTTKTGKPKESELPSTLEKSSKKAQRTFAKAYDSAIDQYGDEKRAHQVAYDALKHSYEKVGDKWEAKDSPARRTLRAPVARTPTARPPAESTRKPRRSTSTSRRRS